MEDQSSLLQNAMQDDPFDIVMRGYNKRQVDDYVLQCQHHIRDLAQRLALAEQQVERVRAEAAAAVEQAASKPVHEEVSERLAQILRLANEEAARERAAAADEIAALKAQALAETQALREQAQAETDDLRQRAQTETEAQRETDALRERVANETDTLRRQTGEQAAQTLESARAEAERVLGTARTAAERELAEAQAEARDVEESARADAERLMRAAQQRAETLIGEAERRATAVNTVLGSRLEVLTATHRDVVRRLGELRGVLVDVLVTDESHGAFEVPPALSPAELHEAALPTPGAPYALTTGEGAEVYEESAPVTGETPAWPAPATPTTPLSMSAVVAAETDTVVLEDSPVEVDAEPAERAPSTGRVPTTAQRLDLSAVTEKSRR